MIDVSARRFKGEHLQLRDFLWYTTEMASYVTAVYTRVRNTDETTYTIFKERVVPIRYPLPRDFDKYPLPLKIITVLLMDTHALARHPLPSVFKISFCFLDYWKLPYETERDGLGDCEDTSIYMGAHLHALARISDTAVNYYVTLGLVKLPDGTMGGHAWVEYRDMDGDWVIYETTLEKAPWRSYREYKAWVTDVLLKEVQYLPIIRFNHKEVRVLRRGELHEVGYMMWSRKNLKYTLTKHTVVCKLRKHLQKLVPST